MQCNLCNGTEFVDTRRRKNSKCSSCLSVERTRLFWMYLKKSGVLAAGKRVLHFAPEVGLAQQISAIVGVQNYFPVDFEPRIYSQVPGVKKFDMTTDFPKLQSNSFDLVLHIHVLEHIPCNIAYLLFHLHRILRPGGTHAFVIPIAGNGWEECFDASQSTEERVLRFGQSDHLRRFGRRNIEQSLGCIVDIKRYLDFDATREFPTTQLAEANITQRLWTGLSGATPILLGKDDYLLR